MKVYSDHAHRPVLRNRFEAQLINTQVSPVFEGAHHITYVELPIWDRIVGWSTPIKLKVVQYEGITFYNLYELEKSNISLVIRNITENNTVVATWTVRGDITNIEYGKFNKDSNKVIESTITIVPKLVIFK